MHKVFKKQQDKQIFFRLHRKCFLNKVTISHFARYSANNIRNEIQLVRKFVSRADFSDQFRKVIMHCKCIGYNINVMRRSACLVINPITIDSFAPLFNCTPD